MAIAALRLGMFFGILIFSVLVLPSYAEEIVKMNCENHAVQNRMGGYVPKWICHNGQIVPINAKQEVQTFEVFTIEEINKLRGEDRDFLLKKISELRQTIEELSAELSRLNDSLPTAVAADPNLVDLLREQLQAEFDERYAQKP